MRMRGLLFLLLAGCSVGIGGPERSGGGAFAPLLQGLIPGQPAPPPSPRFQSLLAEGVPALVVSVEEREAVATFLREAERAGTSSWISPDEVALQLRSGMLVGTRGLGGDLMSVEASQSAALVQARRSGRANRVHGILTGDDQIDLRSYACEVTSRGAREIDPGAGPVQAELMQERCMSPDETFQNLYWVHPPTGDILQSRQWAGELTGPLALREVPR